MKKINNKRIPSYAFGIDQVLGMTNLLGTGIQALSTNRSSQNGYIPEETTSNTVGSALSGGVSGAVAGMSLGPIGAGVGALAGIAGSIFGANKRNKEIRRRNARIRTQNMTNTGLDTQTDLESEYYDDNSLAYTYANGGLVNSNLAYVDNDEILRDAEGNLTQVPDITSGTDQHLINATMLDSVLSDKLMVPGTNKSFAATMGQYVKKPKSASEFTDRYSEAREEAEAITHNLVYNNLLTQQEEVKRQKGIKPKTKGIPAYAYGDNLDNLQDVVNVYADAPIRSPYGIDMTGYNSNLFQNRPISYDGQLGNLKAPRSFIPGDGGKSVEPDTTNLERTFDINNLMSLTPTAFNWLHSLKTPEYDAPINNPYEGSTLRTLAKRRTNINPIIDANRQARSIANYNASNLNSDTGANLALRSQMAVDEYRNNANLFATKQNTDNQYLGDYANMLNNLGQQREQAQTYANDINARNRAASRNYAGTAASQLGQWSQVQQQMRNQRNRDEMIMPFLQSFLEAGFTKQQVQDMVNKFSVNPW